MTNRKYIETVNGYKIYEKVYDQSSANISGYYPIVVKYGKGVNQEYVFMSVKKAEKWCQNH